MSRGDKAEIPRPAVKESLTAHLIELAYQLAPHRKASGELDLKEKQKIKKEQWLHQLLLIYKRRRYYKKL